MKRKRFSSLLIITLLIVSLVVGCTGKQPAGGDQETPAPTEGTKPDDNDQDNGTDEGKWDPNVNEAGVFPIVKEKISLSIFIFLHPDSKVTDYDDNEFTKWLEEKTNIDLEFEAPAMDDANTRIQLLLTTGEYPDILYSHPFGPLEQDLYGKEGTILALNDYIDQYGIETKKMFGMYPDVRDALLRSDGKIYCLPQISDPKSGDSPFKMWIYKPFLEALDMEMPKTTDDLYNYLKAVKDGDPNGNGKADEIPLAGSTAWISWNPIVYLMNAFVYEDNYDKLVLNNGVLEPVYTKSEYKDGLKFIAQLYREELIMNETFTQTHEDLTEIMNNPAPLIGMLPTHAPFVIAGERSPDFIVMPPIEAPGYPGGYASTNYTTNTSGPVITNNCKHPEAAFRFLDMFYEEEVSISVLNGIRGIEWDYNDDPALVNDDGEMAKYKALVNEKRMNSSWPMLTNFYRSPTLSQYWINDSPEGRQEREEAAQGIDDPVNIGIKMFNEAQPKVYANYVPPSDIRMPQVILYDEEASVEAVELRGEILGYVLDMRMKFITGEVDIDAEWDDYIRQLEQLGLERYLSLTQEAYDRIYK